MCHTSEKRSPFIATVQRPYWKLNKPTPDLKEGKQGIGYFHRGFLVFAKGLMLKMFKTSPPRSVPFKGNVKCAPAVGKYLGREPFLPGAAFRVRGGPRGAAAPSAGECGVPPE